MSDPYPEFRLRLPNGGPTARGRLTDERGTNGAQRFALLAGQPVRPDVVDSFAHRVTSAHRKREELIRQELIVRSVSLPEYLETTASLTFNSPSEAAAVLLGRSANGWFEWKTEDGRPLSDFMPGSWPGPNRPWLVRGSNVSGLDLVQRMWLPDGLVTLSASRLRPNVEESARKARTSAEATAPEGITKGITKDFLRTAVEEDYESTATYSQKQQLVEDLYVFLCRMKPGDTVCTISGGELYVGVVTGEFTQVETEDRRSNLRRPVEWQPKGFEYDELPEELQQKLSIQHDIVDLASVQAHIEGLGLSDEELEREAAEIERDPSAEIPAIVVRRELELPYPTQKLATDLLVHKVEWLREVRDLLADERQLVLYGPPGTGKTYLAQKIAEFLGGGAEQVKLVQFHPSYAYEDFIEGFRPKEDPKTKEVAFRINAGPLRELADLAALEGNRHIPYFLIIDEINRANLAKVFGELYFLLEYRRKSVQLPYSGDDFSLPPNLFVIGTMNTADRSIALVDSAMRRRFAFVELSPRIEPTSGLLRRWLESEGKSSEPADLLDALNSRIDEADFRIGPSYLMKPGVYREGGLERTWRTKILPLLEEHHYGEDIDIEKRYGLAALRASLG
ncbi:DUF4357 domain-containing protein [Streptomyces sp. NPDC051173]|uniref:DUF4357 domain-containing protein n=1 Tax=Streptomyces sp. NPDC051173 TaxID=3155164 RepID=UPI00344E812A